MTEDDKTLRVGNVSPSTKLTVTGSFNLAPLKIVLGSGKEPAMTIHPDGKITLGENAEPTEAAAACIDAMSHMIQSMIRKAAADEHDRIIGIIKHRIDLHSEFVKGCMDHEVEPASSVLGAISELRSLLRELGEKQ